MKVIKKIIRNIKQRMHPSKVNLVSMIYVELAEIEARCALNSSSHCREGTICTDDQIGSSNSNLLGLARFRFIDEGGDFLFVVHASASVPVGAAGEY